MIVFCALVLAVLPLIVVVGTREILLVLAEDKLYFYRCEVEQYMSASRKSTSSSFADGEMLYSDIISMEFKRRKFSIQSNRITPPRIIIYGNDFDVTVPAFRFLIKQIEQHKENVSITCIAEPAPETNYGEGLWAIL